MRLAITLNRIPRPPLDETPNKPKPPEEWE